MKVLVQEKEKAIALRKKGFSYNEILKEVSVAKSSLSLWLKDLPLTEQEKQSLKKRRDGNISRGRIKAAGVLTKRRLEREAYWYKEACVVFQKYKNEPLFHAGISLYWAEGSKRVSQWGFTNSDEIMIEVLLLWLERYINIKRASLRFRLYIHKPYAHERCEEWWQKKLGISNSQFRKTIYKPTGLSVKKRPEYRGCLRIEAPKSKHLLVKMKMWQQMVIDSYTKE